LNEKKKIQIGYNLT